MKVTNADAVATALSFVPSDGGDFVLGTSNAKVAFKLNATSMNVKIQVVNAVGKTVYTKTIAKCNKNELNQFLWAGKDSSGNYVSAGSYKVKITAGNKTTEGTTYLKALTQASTGFSGGNGSKSAPYQVTSIAQLKKIATHMNRYFKQTADIDAQYATLEAMGGEDLSFQGNYNGNNYQISNLIVKDGIFMNLGEKGVVQNLTFENCTATKQETIDAGIIASTSKGTVKNCTFTRCTANSSGSDATAGMICGKQEESGNIINCNTSDCSISVSLPSGFVADVYGGSFVGYNSGKIINSMGNKLSVVTQVAGGRETSYAGGITGYNAATGIVTNCTLDGSVTSSDYAGGISAYNEGQIISCTFEGTVEAKTKGIICGKNVGIVTN